MALILLGWFFVCSDMNKVLCDGVKRIFKDALASAILEAVDIFRVSHHAAVDYALDCLTVRVTPCQKRVKLFMLVWLRETITRLKESTRISAVFLVPRRGTRTQDLVFKMCARGL